MTSPTTSIPSTASTPSTPSTPLWQEFYTRLPAIQAYLVSRDPALQSLFATVTVDWPTLIKQPYPALIGALVGQKIRFAQARQIRSQLYSQYGTQFTHVTLMATPLILASCGLDSRTLQIIADVNREIVTRQLDLSQPTHLQQLSCVSGVGPWTLQTTMLSAGMHWDLCPVNDVFLQKKVQQLYALAQKPTEVELRGIAEKWAPYRGIVCWYLWRWF